MEHLFKEKYLEANYYPEKQFVEFIWLPATADMDDEEYKEYVRKQLKAIQDNKSTAIVVDGRNFAYTIDPDMQEWVDNEISPKYIEAGIESMNVVLPSEVFSSAAIEQLLEEAKTSKIETKYYDSLDEAKAAL